MSTKAETVITTRTLNVAMTLITLISVLLSLGVSMGTARMELRGKADQSAFDVHVENEQNELERLAERQALAMEQMSEQQTEVLREVRALKQRVRDIYCEGRGAACQ